MKNMVLLFLILTIASCSDNSSVIVGIQPLGSFDRPLMDTIAASIKDMYGYKVVILPPKQLPKSAFISVKSPRYRADSLLYYLRIIKPDTIDYIIGFTSSDISTTLRDENKEIRKPLYKYADWGVFGLGFMPGSSCVISSFRLTHPNRQKFIERLKKVAVHELGHNRGLEHCTTDRCVMRDANGTINTVDSESLQLCSKCLSRVK